MTQQDLQTLYRLLADQQGQLIRLNMELESIKVKYEIQDKMLADSKMALSEMRESQAEPLEETCNMPEVS